MVSSSIINGVATVICVAVMALPAVAVIIYGIRSRMAYAARIQELNRAGAYKSWGKPPMAGRLRLLGAMGIMGFFGLVVWSVLLLTNRSLALSVPALVIVGIIFLGVLAAGVVLQWLVVHPSGREKT